MDCLFCKIVNGEIPSERVWEDDRTFAFRDIDPKAPAHILIVPKAHADSILDVDDRSLTALFAAARRIAGEQGMDKTGFRVVINTGADGGQTVNHLHLHLLGGRAMAWPPG